MTCEHSMRAELSGYADNELPASDREWWQEHLERCPSCRAELARIQSLRTTLRAHLPPREPSSAFRDDLRRLIGEESSRVARPAPRWGGWAVGLAATLVFALGIGV